MPDEGADATALACGQRVENGFVAVNHSSEPLRSLIYAAEKAQRATGLVTTSSLVQPTPVAFYSTIKGTPDPYRNASELVYSGIDVVLGGGEQYFTPANATNEWGRRDGHDLIDEAKTSGYTVIRTRDELNNVSTWSHAQALRPVRARPVLFFLAATRQSAAALAGGNDPRRHLEAQPQHQRLFPRRGARPRRARGGAEFRQAGGERSGRGRRGDPIGRRICRPRRARHGDQ